MSHLELGLFLLKTHCFWEEDYPPMEYFRSNFLKNCNIGTREIAQWLRELTSFTQNLGSSPSTHIGTYNCI